MFFKAMLIQISKLTMNKLQHVLYCEKRLSVFQVFVLVLTAYNLVVLVLPPLSHQPSFQLQQAAKKLWKTHGALTAQHQPAD